MKPKDRIRAAIHHEKTDRVPWGEIVIDDSVVRSFLQCNQVTFSERLEFVKSLGLDLVCMSPTIPPVPGPPALPKADQAHWGDLGDWAKTSDRFIFVLLDGAFEQGIRLYGLQKFLVSLMRGTPEIVSFIKAVEACNLELARQALDRGAMAVLLADDIAYERGLMANPGVLRSCIIPSLLRQVETINALGLPVFFHSDGNLMQILPDLVSTGIAGLQSLEATAGMNLALVKEAYGLRLCLWGNLDAACLTFPYTREKVVEQINGVLTAVGKSNGFIFGTSSGLYKGIRPENLRWIREALNNAGQT